MAEASKTYHAPGEWQGRPPAAVRYRDQRPASVQAAAQQAKGWRKIRWREGSKGWLESRFWAARAQPSHRYQDGRPPGKDVWLLAEWPESEQAPAKYCLCDLPADYAWRRIVRLVKCRWKIEQDSHRLKEELGLDHYEGRNRQGWHRHVTMVMLAHPFLTLETLRGKKTLLDGPCRGRDVRFGISCSRGRALVPSAAAKCGARSVRDDLT